MNSRYSDVVCVYCGSKLNMVFELETSSVYKCDCYEYPEIEGILYLLKNSISKEAVKQLKLGNIFKAFRLVTGVRLSLALFLYLISRFKFWSNISLNKLLNSLKLFGVEKDWINYLVTRNNSDYFKISLDLLDNLKLSHIKLLDVGCGTGHFLKEASSKKEIVSLVGIDHEFLNLFVSKKLVPDNRVVLLCCDVERPLPFSRKLFDVVHMNDTFQYIKGKKHLLSGISKIIKERGLLSIIHTHKTNIGKGILGIKSNILSSYLNFNGFRSVKVFSDELLSFKLGVGDDVTEFSERLDDKNSRESYSVIASKKDLIKIISKKENKKYLFVSPHLDDAILSSGNLIKRLVNSRNEVRILTVFTKANGPPYSPQAVEHLKNSKHNDAKKLFQIRKNEDKSVAKYMKVKYVHSGYLDAAFRKNDLGKFIYKNSKVQFSGKVSSADNVVMRKVKEDVKKYLDSKTIVLAPLGIGGHVDHVVVRELVSSLKNPKIFWEDFPYNKAKSVVEIFLKEEKKFKQEYEFCFDASSYKKNAISMYKSQFKPLFPNGYYTLREKYYVVKN